MSNPQNSTQTATNLGTVTLPIQNTDNYTVTCTMQLPNVVPTPTPGAGAGTGTGTSAGTQINSQVVTVINHNGSPVLTGPAGARGLQTGPIACTAGDTITVVTSSSLSQDQQPNAVQITIALTQGNP